MPIIKISCLPHRESDPVLRELYRRVVEAVATIPELGIRDETEVTCLFPPDLMLYGLGAEIIVEVTGLFQKPERTPEVLNSLARSLADAVKGMYTESIVEVLVYPFDRTVNGYHRVE